MAGKVARNFKLRIGKSESKPDICLPGSRRMKEIIMIALVYILIVSLHNVLPV
jgi:hypothetical protein